MVVPLNSPQPVFNFPLVDEVPDDEQDTPLPGKHLSGIGALGLPEIVFGAATFHTVYNSTDYFSSGTPLRTVRLALRYGVKAFDTSAYYGPSEIILGAALKALENEFPRQSYQLMTKCGRYGPTQAHFDYSPQTVRRSVERSLARLHTTYLDTVYLHDVEFVCSNPPPAGSHSVALVDKAAEYGLAPDDEGKILGEGDQKILDAVAELRKMKLEGLVRNIGITGKEDSRMTLTSVLKLRTAGYPLPVLLRLAILVLRATGEPLDVLLSYSHLNLQNDTFALYAPQLRHRAKIRQLLTASPLNMGLLTPTPPPWHPAPVGLREAASRAHSICVANGWGRGLPSIALGFAYRKAKELELPTVVGLSNLQEVHETMKVWRELNSETGDVAKKRRAVEALAIDQFSAFEGWSWASP
ncbi:aldo/keto reductase [Phanerochaete sordida]|uniref:Aldo/keto reductase n=1 Tax=Phanerochaete sordida TaxID=48140 RepID=A0A9P3FYR4_9APHY|nr:aldo/keto reductase [Phanerochaete sordida]